MEGESKSEESDKEEYEIQAMAPSEALQKLDDLLLLTHNRQELADTTSKLKNIRLSALRRTDIVKFSK